MNSPPDFILLIILISLIIVSAFFSGSEIAMMALNRYRIRHQARLSHKGAKRVLKLLQRTDRLLGVILIGNNFVNVMASSIATMLALHFFNDVGIFLTTIVLTFALLIFGEVTPKMVASMYPEKVALSASILLALLMKCLAPLAITINWISTLILRAFGIKAAQTHHDQLSQEELRTLVYETGEQLPKKRQGMLLGILDLDNIDVDHIMIPRNEIIGIDLDDDIETIINDLQKIQHTRIPVYRGNINNMVGFLHMRNIIHLSVKQPITKKVIEKSMLPPYFIPEGTSLHNQLLNFQKEKHRLAIIVDEYGDIQGLVALEDILEEIVGKFTTSVDNDEVIACNDDSYLIKGTANIREINKKLHWNLSMNGPKTFNGLIIERLEAIPDGLCCLVIDNYYIEIISISSNKIETARIRYIKNSDQV